ncbi:hypothetical protein GCM10023093_07600 [Nemorincola caseinilytica]|uniref:Lipoprotein n=1 Tax=Nemorincola caseinilytica TaxID=2054315 RepID=A0ABP8N614_9BACT
MKRYWLALLVPALLLGCRKNKNGGDNNGTDDFAYTMKYDSVSSTQNGIDYNFSFYIKVTKGDIADNALRCTVEGLPSSVTVTPASLTVTHLLGGVFTLKLGSLPAGDHPFQLKVDSKKFGVQTYNAVLRIVAAPDYAPILAGTYDSCYNYCEGDLSGRYISVVSAVTDTPYLLRLTNLHQMGSGVVVRAWVSNKVTIPVQTADGKTIWGRGTYSHDARPGHESHYMMSIDDTIVSGLDTLTCTVHVEH